MNFFNQQRHKTVTKNQARFMYGHQYFLQQKYCCSFYLHKPNIIRRSIFKALNSNFYVYLNKIAPPLLLFFGCKNYFISSLPYSKLSIENYFLEEKSFFITFLYLLYTSGMGGQICYFL